MLEEEEEGFGGGYWPSVSDLFITLFIISIVLLAVVFFMLMPKNNLTQEKAVIVAVGLDLKNIREPTNRLRKKLDMELIREQQTPEEVVIAVKETNDRAIKYILDLEAKIKRFKEIVEDLPKIVDLQDEIERLKNELEELRNLTDGPSIEVLTATIEGLKKQLNDKPPIIRIDEQGDYRFPSGSSVIGPKFTEGLNSSEFKMLAEEILGRTEDGRVKVDTLEIIGHTDGVPISGNGNLDDKLPSVLAGRSKLGGGLRPGSNNDLGLLRALAVKQEWEKYISEHPSAKHLSAISVRCYSAGQTILPSNEKGVSPKDFLKGDPKARRIEMRLTRLSSD
ncbi:hypothetical protein OAG70_00405 [bacterium]|nr:hypothetical protein [bacterium]